MNDVKLYVPITKTEQMPDGRLKVQCVMTSEALDHQNEVVDYDGAEKAAVTWKGNIRLGHGGPPVGKRIQLLPSRKSRNMGLEFFVSKTEPDVQEKVREKILDGVSVGGNVREGGRVLVEVDDRLLKRYPKIPVEKKGEKITVLKDWEQVELALVDAAANPESQGLSIVKSLDGQIVSTELLADEEPDAFGLEDTPERHLTLVAVLQSAIEALKPALAMEVEALGDEDHHALETLIHIVDDLRQVAEREKHAAQLAAATEGDSMDSSEKMDTAAGVTKEQADPKSTDATAEGEGSTAGGMFVTKMKEARAALGKAVEMIDKAFSEADGGAEKAEDGEAFAGEETEEEEKLEEEEGAEKKAPMKSAKANGVKKTAAKGDDAVARSLSEVAKALTQIGADVAEMKRSPRAGGPSRMVEKTLAYGGGQAANSETERVMSVVAKAIEKLPTDASKADVDRAIAMAVMRDVQS
jgi:hypothetical protein